VSAEYKDLECSVSIQIASQNIKPVAVFSISPTSPLSGETVYFNAAASYDSDGRIVSYKWDFGDGTTGTGETASHIYITSLSRAFMVILKITDDAGDEGVKNEEIEVKAVL
jgi:PKD repeat protein